MNTSNGSASTTSSVLKRSGAYGMCTFILLAVSLLVGAESVFAHSDGSHGAAHILRSWNTTPRLLIGLALAGSLYAAGLVRLWSRAGFGKGIGVPGAVCYFAGWVLLVVALVSPLDALSDELFSAHMIQHLILILIAAPLIVLGAPVFVAMWALPRRARRAVASWWRRDSLWRASWDLVSQPLLVWSAFFATLWVWHIPELYEAALRSQLVHDLQHLGFLSAACLTWWILLNPMGRLKLSRGSGVLYLFTTSLHAGALGVLLTFSPRGWYSYYVGSTEAWGLTLLQDQQLAGIIMWMPAGLVYIGMAAAIIALWLHESEAADRRLERHADRFFRTEHVSERERLLRREVDCES